MTSPQKPEGRKRKEQDIDLVDLLDHSSDEDGDDAVSGSKKWSGPAVSQDPTRRRSTMPTSLSVNELSDAVRLDANFAFARQLMLDGGRGRGQNHSRRIGSHSRYLLGHSRPGRGVRPFEPPTPCDPGFQNIGRKPPPPCSPRACSLQTLGPQHRPPASMGARSNRSSTPSLPDGPYKKYGRAASILCADQAKHPSIKSGPPPTASPSNVASLPRSEARNTTPRDLSRVQSRFDSPGSSNRKLRNAAVMGARSIVTSSSGPGMVKLGSKDRRRKSPLSGGGHPEIVMDFHRDDLGPVVNKLPRNPLARAGSASEDDDEAAQESSFDIISIADDSDEDVPDEAFSPSRASKCTNLATVGPVNLTEMIEDGATMPPLEKKATAKVTNHEQRTTAFGAGLGLAPLHRTESRKWSSRGHIGNSPQDSSHDVVSIADDSDEDGTPDKAGKSNDYLPLRAVNLATRIESSAVETRGSRSTTKVVPVETSNGRLTDDDPCEVSCSGGTDLTGLGLVESTTTFSRRDLGAAQANLGPDKQYEFGENRILRSVAAESCSLDLSRIVHTEFATRSLADLNRTESITATKGADKEVTNHAPILSDVSCVRNVEREEIYRGPDTKHYGSSQDDNSTQRLSLSCARPDATIHLNTVSIEEIKENTQTGTNGGSQAFQDDTSVCDSPRSEAILLNRVSHATPVCCGRTVCVHDRRASSRDESMDRNSTDEGDGDLALFGSLSAWQLQDLVKPPPLDRIHEFEFLLKSSENKSEWLRAIEKTPGVNVIEEWFDMAKRLRHWQQNEVETESEGEQMFDSTSYRASQSSNAVEGVPEEDRNFRGRRDGPVDVSEDLGSLGVMRSVPMLDETFCDQATGLPARKFSVVSSSDGCLYTFLLRVRTSSLPNAGNGLFLQFLGAKEMKPSKWKRSVEISDRRHNVSHPHDELRALHPEGFGIHVSVTGEHLKSRYNSSFPLKKLKAVLSQNGNSDTGRTMEVTFSDPDLPYDEDESRGLRNPEDYIGHFRLCTIDDYVDAPMRKFSSLYPECGFVDIGRYGPFRKQDRKMELHFQAKSFIFGFEPAMWGFGVQENIWGREQTVDITDDVTGEPHDMAQRNLPMYVNEVGHSNLEETVHACEENDRVIKYFFVIRRPMKKGEEIELFVNYGSRYESNRERKGYGVANFAGKEKGDDHVPSRLRRNFPEREHLILDLEESRMCEFAMVMEFCASLAKPLHDMLDTFLHACTSSVIAISPITAKQVIAIRRLDWMSSIFQARLDEMQNTSHRPVYEVGDMDNLYAFECGEYLPRMMWMKWNELHSVLDENRGIKDKKGKVIWDELRCEAIEEICFKVRDKVVLPCDASRWCPIAIEVTQNLCVATAKTLWAQKKSSSTELLSHQFLKIAKKAADEIKGQPTPSRLAFNKDFDDLFVFDELGAESTAEKAERIIVTKRIHFAGGYEIDKSAAPLLIGCRSAFDESQDQREVIHTTWYLARQVFFLVDAIAQFALVGESAYSRELLLTTIGLDAQTASLALDKVVIPPRGSQVENNDYPRYIPTKQQAIKPSQPREGLGDSSTKSKVADRSEKENSSLFWNIIWPVLKDEHGWTLSHGTRPQDFFACPRNVVKGKNGFRNRVDYFDSVPLIIKFLKTNSSWSTNPDVQRSMDEYTRCFSLYKKVRGTKAIPKFSDRKEQIQWLREQVRSLT